MISISREELEGRTETKRELTVIETLRAQDQIQKAQLISTWQLSSMRKLFLTATLSEMPLIVALHWRE